MSISIRPAIAADESVIVDYNAALAWESEQLRLDRDVLAMGVRAALADSAKATYFIAEIDGQRVGQMMITLEWSDWRNGQIWWIQSVYVAADYRRRGIFTALYKHVAHLARAQNAAGLRLYVMSDNRAAQSTYQAMGMSLSEYLVMEHLWQSHEE
jgi:ribosomal protein S18 acetylase RimI-like enzyme